MLWLYDASHNHFNMLNPDYDLGSIKIDLGDRAKIMNQASHMTTAKAYMTAYFRWQLYNAQEYAGVFQGEWIPASVAQAAGA
ncbi:MAG: hypothetical protein IPP22_08140 [Nitrosomonas sp.]|nr:hypothetical protein [Nitrosomonas sp.]